MESNVPMEAPRFDTPMVPFSRNGVRLPCSPHWRRLQFSFLLRSNPDSAIAPYCIRSHYENHPTYYYRSYTSRPVHLRLRHRELARVRPRDFFNS